MLRLNSEPHPGTDMQHALKRPLQLQLHRHYQWYDDFCLPAKVSKNVVEFLTALERQYLSLWQDELDCGSPPWSG